MQEKRVSCIMAFTWDWTIHGLVALLPTWYTTAGAIFADTLNIFHISLIFIPKNRVHHAFFETTRVFRITQTPRKMVLISYYKEGNDLTRSMILWTLVPQSELL